MTRDGKYEDDEDDEYDGGMRFREEQGGEFCTSTAGIMPLMATTGKTKTTLRSKVGTFSFFLHSTTYKRFSIGAA